MRIWQGKAILGTLALVAATTGTAQADSVRPDALADRARSDTLAQESGVRLVRFTASFDGTIPDRGNDAHYRPSGYVTQTQGDPIVAGQGNYTGVVDSNVDGKGGFTDRGVIVFPTGQLMYEGVYPTHNDTTPVPGLRSTAMVQAVKGGTGAFAGATGYLLINSTLVQRSAGLTAFNGTIVGVVFVKTR